MTSESGRARWLVVGRGISAGLGLALPAVLARTFEPSAFGSYRELFLLATLAVQSLQFGLAQSLFYLVPRAPDLDERRALILQTQRMLAAIGIVAGLVLFALTPALAVHFGNPELLRLGLPLGILTAALLASSHLEVSLTASSRPEASALILVTSELVRVVAMVAPVFMALGLIGLAWGAALAAVLRVVACHVLLEQPHRPAAPGMTRRQLSYALPFGASVLIAAFQQQLHLLLAATFVQPAEFAIYSVGCTQLPLLSIVYLPVSEMLQVRLAQSRRREDATGLFVRAMDQLARVFLPCSAWTIAIGTPAIELVYGTAYVEAAVVLSIAIIGVALHSFPIDGVLKARDRTRALLALSVVKLVLAWPAVVIGFRLGGLPGVISAHIAVEAIARVLGLRLVLRELGVPVTVVLREARIGRHLAVSLGVFACAHAAAIASASPFAACVAGTLAAGLVCVADALARRRSAVGPASQAAPLDRGVLAMGGGRVPPTCATHRPDEAARTSTK